MQNFSEIFTLMFLFFLRAQPLESVEGTSFACLCLVLNIEVKSKLNGTEGISLDLLPLDQEKQVF